MQVASDSGRLRHGANDDSIYGQAGNYTLGPNTGDPADRGSIFGGTGDGLDIDGRVPASGGTDNGTARGDAGDDLSGSNYP